MDSDCFSIFSKVLDVIVEKDLKKVRAGHNHLLGEDTDAAFQPGACHFSDDLNALTWDEEKLERRLGKS